MDRICPSCGSTFVAGLLMNNFPYCNACTPPQATAPCPGCEAAARERDGLKGELTNLRIEVDRMVAEPIICGCGDHIGYAEEIGLSQDGAVCGNCAVGRKDYDARTELATLRARLAAECDAVRAKAIDEDDDYYIIAERFRALLAETEAK